MEDNNPFQPTLKEPVDDSILAKDPVADDFGQLASEPPSNPKAFDFEMPGSNDRTHHGNSVIRDITMDGAVERHDAVTAADDSVPNQADSPKASVVADADSIKTALSDVHSTSDKPVDKKVQKKMAQQAEKLRRQAEKDAAKRAKTSTPRGLDHGAPKRIVITLPMIILVVVAVGLAVVSVMLWKSNDTTTNKLRSANAQVAQLQAEIGNASNATGVSTGQFSSLQSKIAQLTKQQTDDQKTIGDQKNQIGDLTNKLNTAQQQSNNITGLTNNISGLIGNCNVTSGFGVQAPTACKATIVSANGSTPAGLEITQK